MPDKVNKHETTEIACSGKEEYIEQLKKGFSEAADVVDQVTEPIAYIVAAIGPSPEVKGRWEVVFRSGGQPNAVMRLAQAAYEHAQEDTIESMPKELREILNTIKGAIGDRRHGLDDIDLSHVKFSTDPKDIN